jgi:hypothetical protein
LWPTEGKGATDMVAYSFSAGTARAQGDCEVPLRLWAGLHNGADLPVRYLPSDPAVNHPAAWEQDTVPMWVAIGLPARPAAIRPFPAVVRRDCRRQAPSRCVKA